MAGLPEEERRAWLDKLDPEEVAALEWDWGFWGRPKQLAVLGGDYKWEILQCGRGFGKTRTGAEWVRHKCENDPNSRLLAVGPTFSFVRDEMIEGDGILSICPPWNMPHFAESRLILTWPNGAMVRGFGADNPNRIRGKNLTGAWLDEYCAWRPNRRKKSLTQIRFCLRKGDPRILLTTTPQPDQDYEELIEQAEKEPEKYRITYGNSFENKSLSEDYREMISDLIGTSEGEQEVEGRLIRNVSGALFRREWVQLWREKSPPDIAEKVLAVDPADSDSATANNVGIVKFGVDSQRRNGFVIADLTAKMSVNDALKTVCLASQECNQLLIDCQGGTSWVTSLRLYAVSKEMCDIFGPSGCVLPPIVQVTSNENKARRAVTTQSLYQSGRIFHLGYFVNLVRTMTRWVPGAQHSPGDLDALCSAVNHYFGAKPKVKLTYGGR